MTQEYRTKFLNQIREELIKNIDVKNIKQQMSVFLRTLGSQYLCLLSQQQQNQFLIIFQRLYSANQNGKVLIEKFSAYLKKKLQENYQIKESEKAKLLVLLFKDLLVIGGEIFKNSFQIFFGKQLTNQLRILLWQYKLTNQSLQKQFYKYDHLGKGNQFDADIAQNIQTMSRERDQKYSRIQISMIKRLIEFLYRKNKKIVSVNQYYLAQILTNVFLQSNQINKIGSYFLSLNQLVTFYNNISDEQHLANIFEVMELIDRESYEIFTKLIQKQANKNLFLNIFISFCLSLGVSLLNIQCARFTFDQLLIKERNILDIHIMFCIVILILSQNELKTEEIQIKTYFAKSLEIKIDLFQEIFNHIYENIPVTASRFKQIDRFQISKIIKQKMERSVYKLLKKNELTNTFNIKKQIVKREPQISSKKKYFGLINPYVNLD